MNTDFGILSLVPPILTVLLAFLTRQVALSLLAGVFVGATIIYGFNPFYGFINTFSVYVSDSIVNAGHAAILVFTLTIAGMVTIVARMGGTQAIAEKLSKRIKSPRGAQLITSLVGCLVFFDDYANILIVGPTMRPLTDQMHVSREKLAYYVHTTAGIVSGVAVMTTWIGFEMGLVTDAFAELGYDINAFWIVLQNIPYMFYNLLAIAISFLVAFMMRDFGPMYKAEKRARTTGKLFADDAKISLVEVEEMDRKDSRIIYAVLPILTMVSVTFFGIWYAGYQGLEGTVNPFSLEGFRICFGNADPMPVTVWAAVASSLVAGIIAITRVKLSVKETYETWLKGSTGLFEISIIIILAWAMGGVVSDLGTANFLVEQLAGNIQGAIIPAIVFIVSCTVSFSTGTSWGTMPIIFPIAIPLAAAFVEDPTTSPLVIATIAAVLSGSIFGDQTSPISDSSILSSATSGCDLLHHVKTQIPYALVPAFCAVAGYLLVGFTGLNAFIVLGAGVLFIIGFLRLVGKSTSPEDLRK